MIGGTNPIYIRRIFQAYVREYPQKIWPKIWYVYVPPFWDPEIPIEEMAWEWLGDLWDIFGI